MSIYTIEGETRFYGSVDVHGSKNAALPVLIACILNAGENIVHNCPCLSDVESIISILKALGCEVKREGTDVFINSSTLNTFYIPDDLAKQTRSSTLFLGALLARCKKTFIQGFGGCTIGKRPIDYHLDAFKKLGCEISETPYGINCVLNNLKSSVISLSFPSVGATENIMLLSSLTPSTVIIKNAAKEPEIVNLALFLKSMGVKITGEGTDSIIIKGTYSPKNTQIDIIPDRIVASTYLCALGSSYGKIEINNVNPNHLTCLISILRQMGMKIDVYKDVIKCEKSKRLKNINFVKSAPYPYFPTDCQPLLASVMAVSNGKGVLSEGVFENRLNHFERLKKMGADISLFKNTACINGCENLYGQKMDATDLRCGASICISAMGALGTSEISNICYIERGYEDFCTNFKKIGAKIERR